MQNTDNRQVQVYLDGEEYIVYLLPERGDMTYFGTFLHEGVLAFGGITTTTVDEFMSYFFNKSNCMV